MGRNGGHSTPVYQRDWFFMAFEFGMVPVECGGKEGGAVGHTISISSKIEATRAQERSKHHVRAVKLFCALVSVVSQT